MSLKETTSAQRILDLSGIGTWRWNVQTGDAQFNEAWANIIGYSLDELQPINISTWLSHAHEDDLKVSERELQKHFDGEIPLYQVKARMRHKKGHWVWVLNKGCVETRTPDGKPEWMIGSHTEITAIAEEVNSAVRSKKLYRSLIQNSPFAKAVFNKNMEYVAVSKKWLADYGLKGENIIGKAHYEVFPEITDDWKKIHQEVLEGAVRKNDCDLFIREDGTKQYLKWQCRPWYNEDDEIVGLIAFSDDITESLKKNYELERYKSLLDNINRAAKIGNWEVDFTQEPAKVTWGPITRKIHGVDENYTPLVETGLSFYPEPYRAEVQKSLEASLASGEKFVLKSMIETKQKEKKWVTVIGIPEKIDGKITSIYGTFQDITEETEALNKVTISEQKFKAIFRDSSIGIALMGLKGEWLNVNLGICNLLGYNQEELLNKTFKEITYPEDFKVHLGLFKECLSGKISEYQIEKRYYSKSKNIVWAHLAVTLIRDANNEPVHFVAQFTDITHLKNLIDITSQQNNSLLNFAHIVSHNLRSHTGNLRMILELLENDEPEATQNDYFPLLKEASTNLDTTITHLNEVVSITTNTNKKLQELNLLSYVEKAVGNLKGLIIKTLAKVEINIDSSIHVLSVPAYLESIILNLLTNSLKYRSKNRIPQLKIYARQAKDLVALSFEDNGLGIDLNKHGDKLFGMYKTFHKNEDSRGIGLFLTKNQIESMGGSIKVKSEVDKGTTFTINLRYE